MQDVGDLRLLLINKVELLSINCLPDYLERALWDSYIRHLGAGVGQNTARATAFRRPSSPRNIPSPRAVGAVSTGTSGTCLFGA